MFSAANSQFSLWEKKYSKWPHNCSFWVFFYLSLQQDCLTCWESQRDKNYSLWENLFSYQAKIFSFWERVENKKQFFVSLRIPLFSTKYITLKLNQKTISKISNYLTQNTFRIHPGNLPLKEIAFNEFKLTHTKTNQISEPSFFKGYCFKILNITAQKQV